MTEKMKNEIKNKWFLSLHKLRTAQFTINTLNIKISLVATKYEVGKLLHYNICQSWDRQENHIFTMGNPALLLTKIYRNCL